MAMCSLPLTHTKESVDLMLGTMTKDRSTVVDMIKRELDTLLRWGAETCGMTFIDRSASVKRQCLLPKNIRSSYLQDGSLSNLKRVLWM